MKLTRRRFLELLGLGAVAAAVGGAKVLEGAVESVKPATNGIGCFVVPKDGCTLLEEGEPVISTDDDLGGYIVPEPYASEIVRRFGSRTTTWDDCDEVTSTQSSCEDSTLYVDHISNLHLYAYSDRDGWVKIANA